MRSKHAWCLNGLGMDMPIRPARTPCHCTCNHVQICEQTAVAEYWRNEQADVKIGSERGTVRQNVDVKGKLLKQ